MGIERLLYVALTVRESPEVMGQVLGIVYRCIASHLINKAGFSRNRAQTGAVILIQRIGSALNLKMPQGRFS